VRVPSFLISFMVPALVVAGCSAKDDPPEQGTLNINFTSAQAAVVTETLTTFVFDATGSPNLCLQLVSARSSAQVQPAWPVAPIATGPTVTTCDMLTRPVGLPPVSFGERAVAVLGFSSTGAEWMIGCTQLSLGEGNFPLPITMVPIHSTVNNLPGPFNQALAGTKCTTLGQYCATKSCPQ